MNPYHEEKEKRKMRSIQSGWKIILFSAIIYYFSEFGENCHCWSWATVGFFTNEFIRDFRHYLALRKLLSRATVGRDL